MENLFTGLTFFVILIAPANIYSQDIFIAIMQGDLAKTKELIKADSSNVTTKNPRGIAPIHFAANFKQFEIVKLLVKNGADPFVLGTFNRQPMHWAATKMPMTIQKMSKLNQVWTEPVTASFSGKFSDGECFITADNKNLFLISQRPHDGEDNPSNWEIWIADRIGDDWDDFRLFDTINLKGCFYPSLTNDGELLFTDANNILFLSKLINGKVDTIKKLGKEINTDGGAYNAMISPKGDYIIFTSHGFEDHYGGGDLYISFRKNDGSWAQSINMGSEINTEATEYCPNISPDEKYFFCTSNKKGTEDIYWVDAAIIESLRSESLDE